MFNLRRGVVDFDVRKCICRTLIPNQHRITLRIVSALFGSRSHFDKPSISIVRLISCNPFRDDRRARIFPDVDHLCSRIGLHVSICQCNRIKFTYRIIPL